MVPARFLETKFHIPTWRISSISRPRLVEQLHIGLREGRHLTLVSAPAGYGKSTLVTEWIHALAASTFRIIWLSIDESDNTPTRFLSYLLSTFSRIDQNIGKNALALIEIPQFASSTAVLDELLNDLSELKSPILLVLDDYHLITNPAIHEALTYFVENQPEQLHLVITTRADPPLPIARLRARAEVTEIRAHHLRFTLDETRQFFNQAHLEIETQWIDTLEARTEGWAAGLQLAALALQNLPNQQDFIQTFQGSHRYILDYLAEEVIRQQGDEITRFLTQTSVLLRFNAALCNAITGRSDSQALLSHLEEANLFLIPLDHTRNWYRYHHLFGDYLRTGLAQNEQGRLLEKASAWYEDNELLFEAVGCALSSGNTEFAADVIERVMKDGSIWSSGYLSTLLGWLESLPAEALHSRPVLSLNASRVLYLTGLFDQSETLLNQAQGSLDKLEIAEKERWLAAADTYHGAIAAQRGEIQRAIALTSGALERLPQNDLLIRARAAFTLAFAFDSSGSTQQAIHTYLEASTLAQSTGVSYLAINALCEAALLQIQQGLLQQAAQTCQTALDLCGNELIPPAGIALSIQGEIARERNDLSTARRCLTEGIELSKQGGITEDLRPELWFLARLKAASGDMIGAQKAASQAVSLMNSYRTPRFTTLAAAFQARMQMTAGDTQSALHWAHAYRVLRQAQNAEYLREFEDLTLAQILFIDGQSEEALNILNKLIPQAQEGGRNRVIMEGLLIKADLHLAKQDTSAAIKSLESALSLAAPGGFFRLFIDSGTAVHHLLPQARHIAPLFVDEVLHMLNSSMCETSTDSDLAPGMEELIKPLSEQERRVLRLIAAGKSNREIAAELVISPGTAKWHVHNILQKLGVNNRPQAIARARELGFE
jgi:LuxR family transcriptional regulator, maltose regulon positive regulatory protein